MISASELYILILIPSFALTIGMLGAFLSSKKGNKQSQHFKEAMSSSLGHGYLVGNLSCIISFVSLELLVCMIIDIPLSETLGILVFLTLGITFISFIVGLILYLPCAFFGYNLYARRLAEQEIARSQKQILREIQTKESSEE
jgi:hypothetical protein